MGQTRATRRIVTKEALLKGAITATQDGSREFITLIASISADGAHIAPTLIYKAESHAIQDVWVENVTQEDRVHFSVSENGWSSDEMGLAWLKEVFDRQTQPVSGRNARLLIVDGHSSHVNMDFLNFASEKRILIAVLPPHSTHRLQPLDVGLFSPLATYYSQGLDNLLAECQGLSSMGKQDFWPLFKNAFARSFTEENVRSAWSATGIWPHDPERVLKRIRRESLKAHASNELEAGTPQTARSLRYKFLQLKDSGHLDEEATILLNAGEKLAAKLQLAQSEIDGLKKTLFREKKKKKPASQSTS